MAKVLKVIVRELGDPKTAKVVREFDVSSKSESYIERLTLNLLRNMNVDKYCVDEVHEKKGGDEVSEHEFEVEAGIPSPGAAEQPMSKPNDSIPIWDLVRADIAERDKLGRERYGTPLQAFNGRDALVDAYQESLDLVVYLRQEIEERAARKRRLAASFQNNTLQPVSSSRKPWSWWSR